MKELKLKNDGCQHDLKVKMGYEKEIILIKNITNADFSAFDLLTVFKPTEWNETLAVINRGDDFDWVNAKNKAEFSEILKDKMGNNEHIGFAIQNQNNKRYVTVNMNENTIIFSLDIGKEENEKKWFNWYHKNLIPNLKKIIDRVEWRSGYDNKVIKQIDKESI